MKNIERLDKQAEAAILLHARKRSKIFFDAAIESVIAVYGTSKAIEICETMAAHLKEFE